MIGAALLFALQSTTALPVNPEPLEPGRWVFRRTQERGTGASAVSATLLSNDRTIRLVLRCDVTYDRTVSLQLLRNPRDGVFFRLPVSLGRSGSADPFPLDWEQSAFGVFARDGEDELPVSQTAASIQAAPGRLHVNVAAGRGQSVTAEFDNRDGREEIGRVLAACAPVEAEEAGAP
jgi:hypothetical protein